MFETRATTRAKINSYGLLNLSAPNKNSVRALHKSLKAESGFASSEMHGKQFIFSLELRKPKRA